MKDYVFVVYFDSGQSQVFADRMEAESKLLPVIQENYIIEPIKMAPGFKEVSTGNFWRMRNGDCEIPSVNAIWTEAARAEAELTSKGNAK